MNDNSRFIFSTNYNDPLIGKENPFPDIVEAVLLSERYSTRASLNKIAKAKANGYIVISDNGNFSRMSKIAQKFLAKGENLLKEAEKQFQSKGIVSDDILLKRILLINEIEDYCKLEIQKVDFNKLISKQISCNPDYLIALED